MPSNSEEHGPSADVRVVAHARDVHTRESVIVLRARSLKGPWRRVYLPGADLGRTESALFAELGKAGCPVPFTRRERNRLLESLAHPSGPALPLVTRAGWLDESHAAYVTPFGRLRPALACDAVVDPARMLPRERARSGTLKEWKLYVAAPLRGNATAMLMVMAALAGPVLSLMGEEPFGFHLVGMSSIGKSTILLVACSVWGGGSGKLGFGRSWLTTANGLEELQRHHRDGFLALDEAGLAGETPAEIGEVILHAIHRLVGAEDKVRHDRSLPVAASRLVFLGTSEHWLDEHAAAAGRKVDAGHRVRLSEIAADAGRGLGAFERAPPGVASADFSDWLQEAARA